MAYTKQKFTKGQVLKAEHLNSIEDAIKKIDSNIYFIDCDVELESDASGMIDISYLQEGNVGDYLLDADKRLWEIISIESGQIVKLSLAESNQITKNADKIRQLEEDIEDLEENGIGGVSNYEELENIPTINGIELKGAMTNETLGLASPSEEQITNAINNYLDENGVETTDVGKKLYEQGLVEQLGDEYKKYPIQVEDYSWNHLAGTKRLAPLVDKATLFTTEGATAHEANAVGFDNKWFVFQWVQNIKGTTVDMEDNLGSCEIQGKLMYWRYGIAYDLTAQSQAFTIAKQGDTIKRTIANDTLTASGGVGICNVANKDTLSVYSIATYWHSNKHIPTTRVLTIDSTDYTTALDGKVTVGEAIVWTITKDGVTKDWDDNILGTEYGGHPNCQIYCDYNSSGYNYYMAVVRPNKGISMITSTDCTNWTWLADIDIPCENTAYIETALYNFINVATPRWYVAVRCKDGRLWIAKLLDDYSLNWSFFINDCGSKPVFIRWNKTLLLATAPQSRYSCRLYRFTNNNKDLNRDYYPNRIEAIGDIVYNACNYPFFCGGEGYPNYLKTVSPDGQFLCLGTNNFVTNKLGCSYFIDKLFKYNYLPNEAVNSLNNELPIANSTTLGGVKPIAKTTSMTQEVGVDENGALFTKPSSSGGGTSWETVANETLEAEAKAFTTITFETPRTINHIKAYLEVIGTATNTEEYSIDIDVNGKNVMRSQKCIVKTDGTKKFAYFDIDITSIGTFSKGYVQTANGDTWSSQACNQFGDTITSTTEVSNIVVRSKLNWGTLGVGSKLLLTVC